MTCNVQNKQCCEKELLHCAGTESAVPCCLAYETLLSGNCSSERDVHIVSLYPGPVTDDPGNKMSGCFPALGAPRLRGNQEGQSYFLVRGKTGLHGEGSV